MAQMRRLENQRTRTEKWRRRLEDQVTKTEMWWLEVLRTRTNNHTYQKCDDGGLTTFNQRRNAAAAVAA